jgi:hypothetical protein
METINKPKSFVKRSPWSDNFSASNWQKSFNLSAFVYIDGLHILTWQFTGYILPEATHLV